MVIARRAQPRRGRSWLSEAAARIGTKLDLTQTAREVADVAVPGFADAAARLLRPGEVLVFGPDSPSARAMATGGPVAYEQLDPEFVHRIERRPGGPEVTASYTSFLAVPLIAGGVVVGCATFGRAARL